MSRYTLLDTLGGLMKKHKVLSALVPIEEYSKVVSFIDKFNNVKGTNLSISQFVWRAIRYYINYLIKNR